MDYKFKVKSSSVSATIIIFYKNNNSCLLFSVVLSEESQFCCAKSQIDCLRIDCQLERTKAHLLYYKLALIYSVTFIFLCS